MCLYFLSDTHTHNRQRLSLSPIDAHFFGSKQKGLRATGEAGAPMGFLIKYPSSMSALGAEGAEKQKGKCPPPNCAPLFLSDGKNNVSLFSGQKCENVGVYLGVPCGAVTWGARHPQRHPKLLSIQHLSRLLIPHPTSLQTVSPAFLSPIS